MDTPHNGNGSIEDPLRRNGNRPDDYDSFPDPEAFFAAVHRDPEAAARVLMRAIDRLLAECPLHPEPAGAPGTDACPMCGSGFQC